jgi:hypothetical protein
MESSDIFDDVELRRLSDWGDVGGRVTVVLSITV